MIVYSIFILQLFISNQVIIFYRVANFVFVQFHTPEQASEVINQWNSEKVDGSVLSFLPREHINITAYLWLWELPNDISVKDVLNTFTTATTAHIITKG